MAAGVTISMADAVKIRSGLYPTNPKIAYEDHHQQTILSQYHRRQPNGIEQFIRARLKSLKRFQYGLIFIVCTAVLLFQVGQCAFKYLDKETGTADKYVHVSNASFPELSICPTYPYKLDVLQANGIEKTWDLQFGANWISNDTTKSAQEFYNEFTLDAADVIVDVLFYLEQPIDGSNILKVRPDQTVCNGSQWYKHKEYYFNGDCFTLTLPECLHKAGVLEVVFDFTNKTDIFIHHSGQFLSPNSRSRVDVALGYFTKIAINHEVVQMLGGEDFSTCVDSFGAYQDFDACMYNQMQELMINQVGCTVPWIPDKSKICTESGKSKTAFEIYQQNRRNQKDICPNSCLFTNMYFGPPVTGQNNKARQNVAWGVFYFRRDIKVTKEYILYSLLSLAAEIGGYVGLLLGASLVNIGQINNVLLDYFYGDENDPSFMMENNDKVRSKSPFKRIKVNEINITRKLSHDNGVFPGYIG